MTRKREIFKRNVMLMTALESEVLDPLSNIFLMALVFSLIQMSCNIYRENVRLKTACTVCWIDCMGNNIFLLFCRISSFNQINNIRPFIIFFTCLSDYVRFCLIDFTTFRLYVVFRPSFFIKISKYHVFESYFKT